jgi:hypothetical protein
MYPFMVAASTAVIVGHDEVILEEDSTVDSNRDEILKEMERFQLSTVCALLRESPVALYSFHF